MEPGVNGEERVLDALYEMIAGQELRPGQPVRQDHLASRAGVSRVPVRQVLSRLDARGLVRVVPNKGAFLTELNSSQLLELHAVRELLENEALRLAIRGATDEDVRQAEKQLMELEAAMDLGDDVKVSVANRDFHWRLLRACGNSFLQNEIERCWEITMPYRSTYLSIHQRWQKLRDQHRRILTALQERDEEAFVAESSAHRNQFVTELLPWLKQGTKATDRGQE